MRAVLIILFVFGLHQIVWSQEGLIILQNESIEFEADGFYIEKVEDVRANKENIGSVQKGVFKKTKIDANLKGDVEKAIYNYLKENFRQDTNGVPIVICITQLEISETPGLPITGKAEIKIDFCREENGSLGKLYNAEAYVEKPAVNVSKTHEERIREVIVSCLENFNNSDWETIAPMFFKESEKN
jgi:hypothetical protein